MKSGIIWSVRKDSLDRFSRLIITGLYSVGTPLSRLRLVPSSCRHLEVRESGTKGRAQCRRSTRFRFRGCVLGNPVLLSRVDWVVSRSNLGDRRPIRELPNNWGLLRRITSAASWQGNEGGVDQSVDSRGGFLVPEKGRGTRGDRGAVNRISPVAG
ncbi:hypothetical protein BDV41DRAFT_351454 [Aspergillus transmontanensis]|uniref:Uncharacterized protein n=1 Tax=Aspergillus transmontanensis TaxID=1034304 RepID=A0A5N6VTF1_9EURO|nr:hypothetical protein BDV41DRAFT_351454 [Aspergillus transmontanensis]